MDDHDLGIETARWRRTHLTRVHPPFTSIGRDQRALCVPIISLRPVAPSLAVTRVLIAAAQRASRIIHPIPAVAPQLTGTEIVITGSRRSPQRRSAHHTTAAFRSGGCALRYRRVKSRRVGSSAPAPGPPESPQGDLMPTAICGDCGLEVYWRAQRGARLADIPCPDGHGCVLNAARYDVAEGRYIIVDAPSRSRGQKFGRCAMPQCGKRRLTRKLRTVPIDLRAVFGGVLIRAGSTICRWHEISRECGPYGCLECHKQESA